MNDWNDSEWFQMWLDLARHLPTTRERTEAQSNQNGEGCSKPRAMEGS